jgi:hypothetical protein
MCHEKGRKGGRAERARRPRGRRPFRDSRQSRQGGRQSDFRDAKGALFRTGGVTKRGGSRGGEGRGGDLSTGGTGTSPPWPGEHGQASRGEKAGLILPQGRIRKGRAAASWPRSGNSPGPERSRPVARRPVTPAQGPGVVTAGAVQGQWPCHGPVTPSVTPAVTRPRRAGALGQTRARSHFRGGLESGTSTWPRRAGPALEVPAALPRERRCAFT